ncbi:hypothetical protein GA0071314_3555 [Halomonas sp. HL-93]|nr:hypothetical protein GA0071314_3555 [Halomonas sp. HL-93]
MSLFTLMTAQFQYLSLHHEGNLTNYQPWTRGLMPRELNVLSAPPTPCYHAPKTGFQRVLLWKSYANVLRFNYVVIQDAR